MCVSFILMNILRHLTTGLDEKNIKLKKKLLKIVKLFKAKHYCLK